MPLDANKIAHIQSTIQKTFSSRQKPVVFVYQANGSYTYTAVQVIFRPQSIIDPQISDAGGAPPGPICDLLLIAPISTNFSGLIMIADTSTASASAVATAPKYELIEALPAGIVPGGTHIIARLRRFH